MHGKKEKHTKRQSMAHGRQSLRNTNPTKNRKWNHACRNDQQFLLH